MIKTAVVILNYNGEKLLQQFLPSVINFTPTADIVVIDNGSNDNSIQLLAEEFSSVQVIALDKNYGFCGGYNRGLAQIKAEYVVLLNSDVEVTSGWLEPMTQLLDAHPDIAAVQPKILSFYNRSNFEYAGAAGGFIDTLGYPFCRGRVFDFVESDHGQYDDEREIFWASGACMLIRHDRYQKHGGLDEDLFAHMEEIDLCWKIHRTDEKIYYCGRSTVYHVGAGTLGYKSSRKTYLNFRNALILVIKHFSLGEMLYKFPLRLALDWVAAAAFLLKGEFANSAAVAKAHVHLGFNLGKTLRKRRAIQREHPVYTRDTIYNRLAIVSYYLFRRKSLVD